MTNEQRIIALINEVHNNPMVNIHDAATMYLSGIPYGSPKRITVPELLDLTPIKRAMVSNVIKSKTNIEISSSNDITRGFLSIKKLGEVITSLPELAHGIKLFRR